MPIRWVVERSNAWHGRCRRNSKDDERRTDSSESMIQISHIGIMLRRAAPGKLQKFNYRNTAACRQEKQRQNSRIDSHDRQCGTKSGRSAASTFPSLDTNHSHESFVVGLATP